MSPTRHFPAHIYSLLMAGNLSHRLLPTSSLCTRCPSSLPRTPLCPAQLVLRL